MLLFDTNVWFALVLTGHTFHDPARAFLKSETTVSSVAFCRSTQQSFLRLLTTEAVVKPYGVSAFTNAQAWELYERYLADPRIALVEEPKNVDAHWKVFTARATPSPKMWMDAYLAAFSVAGGHRLVTTDKAFAQYTGLDYLVLTSKVPPP